MRELGAGCAVMAVVVAFAGGAAGASDVMGVEPGAPVAESECHLYHPGAARAPAEECLACHREMAGVSSTHPVDIDYGAARLGSPSSLRSPEEVVKRGVFLPDGQVRCGTCHDARSPWKYRLALPPTAQLRPAVNPAVPSTYESATASPPAPGGSVSPTPLCKACHAYD